MKELRKNFDKVAVYGALALGVVALSGGGIDRAARNKS
jgi:hypothetical protein